MHIDDFKSAIDKALDLCLEAKDDEYVGNCYSLEAGFIDYLSYEDCKLHRLYREYCVSMGDDIETTAYWHGIDKKSDNGCWELDFEATYKRRVERLNGFRDWIIANKKYGGL